MAQILDSRDLSELLANHELTEEGILWAYNALDCCITYEVEEHLLSIDTVDSKRVYNFSISQQGPALAMMLQGILVDIWEKERLRTSLIRRQDRLQVLLNIYAKEVWGKRLNPLSPQQLCEFFYEAMDIEPIMRYDKISGTRKLTCDEKALTKIRDTHFYAEPIARVILRFKEIQGKVKVLKSGVDLDNRMRMSYNVAAAETGRWSSSKNIKGGGTNGQNITQEMRAVFIPDPGKRLAYLDLEQAESRAVAYLAEDEAYIEACESGDLHTAVCRMIWPDLNWSGDLDTDRYMCDSQMFDSLHSYRHMAKASGHATNYYASAQTLARSNKVSLSSMESFKADYLGRFSAISEWHQKVAQELGTTGTITTPLGRKRQFFGRLNDDSTLREAIAFGPQSVIADVLNMALLKVWTALQVQQPLVEVLAQVHDAILFQYDEEREDEVIPHALSLMEIPVEINGRIMLVPVEAKIGYDWRTMYKYGSQALTKLSRRSSDFLDRPIL